MPRVDLLESGHYYTADFSILDTGWLLSPDDQSCFALTAGGLVLQPAAADSNFVLALSRHIREPYLIEVSFDYIPQSVNDSAGLTLWAHQDEVIYISLVTGGSLYSKLRLRVVGERCEAYAFSPSANAWEIIGTALVPTDAVPGVYAEGQAPALIQSFTVVRDSHITVSNLPADSRVYLLNSQDENIGTGIAINGRAVISVSHLFPVFVGKLQIVNQSHQVLVVTDLLNMHGGDLYWYNTFEMNLYRQGQIVLPEYGIKADMLYNAVWEERLEIENTGQQATPYVAVRCLHFNTTGGDRWVSLAHDVHGSPGKYYNMLYLPGLAPEERTAFWLKIARPADVTYHPFAEYRFSLFISGGDQ